MYVIFTASTQCLGENYRSLAGREIHIYTRAHVRNRERVTNSISSNAYVCVCVCMRIMDVSVCQVYSYLCVCMCVNKISRVLLTPPPPHQPEKEIVKCVYLFVCVCVHHAKPLHHHCPQGPSTHTQTGK